MLLIFTYNLPNPPGASPITGAEEVFLTPMGVWGPL